MHGFNPPPALMPGETDGVDTERASVCFNPPPALMPGETTRVVVTAATFRFNPPPALMPGETCRPATAASPGFNPPPALMPGETPAGSAALQAVEFQSAPGVDAGGNTASAPALGDAVSIRPRR